MKNLLIASSLAVASFTALADGSGHQEWLRNASKSTSAEAQAEAQAVTTGAGAPARTTQVAQEQALSGKRTGAQAAKNCSYARLGLSWCGVAVPHGAES